MPRCAKLGQLPSACVHKELPPLTHAAPALPPPLPRCAPSPPPQGRIFVLEAQGGKFRVVCEKETRGAVYALTEFQGRLLAGINSRVQMYT